MSNVITDVTEIYKIFHDYSGVQTEKTIGESEYLIVTPDKIFDTESKKLDEWKLVDNNSKKIIILKFGSGLSVSVLDELPKIDSQDTKITVSEKSYKIKSKVNEDGIQTVTTIIDNKESKSEFIIFEFPRIRNKLASLLDKSADKYEEEIKNEFMTIQIPLKECANNLLIANQPKYAIPLKHVFNDLVKKQTVKSLITIFDNFETILRNMKISTVPLVVSECNKIIEIIKKI